jgi:hypothetical protein
MILGIPYIVWFGMLGVIALGLWLSPNKKKSKSNPIAAEGDIDSYIKSLQEVTEMRWVKLRVNPEDLTTVLNMIEDSKISVMYQFFLRENGYDMLFRCQKNKIEEFKRLMSEYI